MAMGVMDRVAGVVQAVDSLDRIAHCWHLVTLSRLGTGVLRLPVLSRAQTLECEITRIRQPCSSWHWIHL